MLRATLLSCVLLLPTFFASAFAGELDFAAENLFANTVQIPLNYSNHYQPVCHGISRSLSHASQVFYPGSPQFAEDITLWVNSTSRISACSVRPGTAEDLGYILRDLGITHTPFGIKCSGHNPNPGFASTPGVQISMSRFKDIILNEEEGTVQIGAGLNWTEVYSYLVPKGVTVAGGRIDGVGVGGFILGGGYSWKTNQHGLTIDTVTEYELVLPNGTVKHVTEKDEDLWFALRGGSNNFGIVTKFTLKTFKQTDIWGALLAFTGDEIEPAYTAFSKWTSVEHDRKGVQIGAITYGDGMVGFQMILFYDGPKLPEGFYDDFLNLQSSAKVIIEGDFRNFLASLIVPKSERVHTDGVPILHYSVPVLKATVEYVKTLGDELREKDKDIAIGFYPEPFESDIFTHGAPSAHPPDRSRTIHPSAVFVGWKEEDLDKDNYVYDSVRKLSASILESAIKDGQDLKDAAPYVNYAIYGTPLEKLYGKNVERLREIKEKYDPFFVMDLTGGFKL